MTTPLTLPEFLARALDADEAVARDWRHHGARKVKIYGGGQGYEALVNPARVLAEVASKRAILALHSVRDSTAARPICDTCWTDQFAGYLDFPCPTLRHLAAPYSSDPDFDPSWAVS